MRIKTQLQLSSVFLIGTVLVLAAILLESSRAVDKAIEKAKVADEIIQDLFALNAFTDEYLLHGGQRAQEQWQAKYDEIGTMLARQERFSVVREQAILDNIRQDHKSIKDVFSRLISLRDTRPGRGVEATLAALIPELEERIAGQIRVRSHAIIAEARQLSEASLGESASVRGNANVITLTLIVVLVLVSAGSSFLLYRSLVAVLTKLHHGTKVIAGGELSHRIEVESGDEIGEVAEAFNEMAARLRSSYEQLRMLNADLEDRVLARTAELSTTLKEREVLLQEIHHRVKNNLQVISSLINMQMRKLDQGASRNALEECRARVQVIALVHEKLYQSHDYASIHFAEYARSLVSSVFHVTGISQRAVRLEVEIGNVVLAVDKAIPCGLILNELITNALKHGFPGGRTGVIRVELENIGEGRVTMVVRDDGIGIRADVDVMQSESLGLQLVRTLADQLDAKLDVRQAQPGTEFRLEFQV